MDWDKHGLIINTSTTDPCQFTHAMVPTPIKLKNGDIRLFYNRLDASNQSCPAFIDLCGENPLKVKYINNRPLLSEARFGCFDDAGVQACSFVSLPDDTLYMYYAGYEKCNKVPYRIMTGLAISHDGGISFERYKDVPILDRCQDELFVRGGPCCIYDNNLFRMWYAAGSKWISTGNDAKKPSYSIHYLESSDGLNWIGKPEVHLLADDSWYALGRPYVLKYSSSLYMMIYSQRHISDASYHMNLATSKDGYHWKYEHKVKNLGIEVSTREFEDKSVEYGALFRGKDKLYCFYNGNNYGSDGIAFASTNLVD